MGLFQAHSHVEPRHQTQVMQVFMAGIGRHTAQLIWQQLDVLRQSHREKVYTQEELAHWVNRAQGTVSRWFNDSSPDWTKMSVVLTLLDVELAHLELPIRSDRIRQAYIAAIVHVQRKYLKTLSNPGPTPAELVCLVTLYHTREWFIAETISNAFDRERRLNAIAERITAAASERYGQRVPVQTANQYQNLTATWGPAYVLARSIIPCQWETLV